MLPTREALRLGRPQLVSTFATAAEAAGVSSLWAGDSLLARPLYDPIAVLSTAAAVTHRVNLGTGALLAPMRPIALTAQSLASLDQLSGGRLIVGVGRGLDLPETRREFAAAGSPFEQRSRRLDDAISVWRALWRSSPDAPAVFEAEYCTLDAVDFSPKPAQPDGPPIWIAGYGPRAFRRVAEVGDGWLPYPPRPEDYHVGWDAITSQAQAGGRDPGTITPAVMVNVSVGPNPASQIAMESYIETFYGYPLEMVSLLQACVSGQASQVVDTLRAYWDAGARVFLLRLASLDDPLGALELAASSVLPEVQSWASEQGTVTA